MRHAIAALTRARVGTRATLLALLLTAAWACGDSDSEPTIIVFSGEANRLNAYDATTLTKQNVIPSARDDSQSGRDINGQICFFPDGSRRFIAGEDTGQPDPPQGWGVFQLHGRRVGELSATQIGKLTPTYQNTLDNAENYGCGFLSDGRLLTTDVGNQASGPGNGQLIVWFPPFDRSPEEQRYCKLDVAIGTAGGICVDRHDHIYVASARGAGILRYSGPFPTSNDAAGGCGHIDGTGAPLADNVTREAFISDPSVPTAGSIVQTPGGTFYVGSVLNGVIAEFDAEGRLLRRVLDPPDPALPIPTGTPYGIALDSRGTLYYADIGLTIGPDGIGPGTAGSVRRIRFENGVPLPPETIDTGLGFPDGLGVLEE